MTFQDSTVLVTGGAGFVGSNLVERLLGEGARVRVLDDFSTGRRENLMGFQGRFELVEGSVTDADACAHACGGTDFVFHQAALPSIARSLADPGRTHEVSATGTLNMLRAAHAAGVKRFVCAGSSSAYGNTVELPKREDMPARPRSPYAVAKLAGEQYAQVYAELFGLETVVLRYFNVFGPRQDPGSLYSAAIPLFIVAALEGRAPTIHGDGAQTRDFTFVENVVEANLKACLAPASRASGQVFNVGCGERVSIRRLWHEIRAIVGVELEAHHAEPRPGDVRDSLADLTRIRAYLGYEGSVDLAEGLRRTVEWLRGTHAAG
ncbi:MAG TPA: SDR family oxidoreductase [Longimicrobiales bacterium]|nr:SDR family oxidoreductase [Longimicrobiales bacterium]